MNKIVTAERSRLAPFIERLSGSEMRVDFRDAFESAAGRYALGRIDVAEFRAVVGELIRDAAGTSAGQDRAADARSPLAPPAERLTVPERVVYGAIGVGCVLVLVWLAYLLSGFGSFPDAPAYPSVVPAVNVTDNGTDARELITRGAYWSWAAADGCGRGPAECDRVMREVNGEAYAYGLRVFEDGSVAPYTY